MIIDRTHRRWVIATLAIIILSVAFYIPYSHRLNGPQGESWPGLTFGSIALFFVLVAAGIQVRKRVRTWRIGRAQTWMRAHIWLGLLSFPMALFHSGFHFGPAFSLAWVMMWSFVIVIISGVFGLFLQHILPRMMLKQIRKETIVDQVENVRKQLRWESDWIISGVCGELPAEMLDQVHLQAMLHSKKVEADHKKAVAAAKKAKAKAPEAPVKVVANPAKMQPWQAAHGIRDPKDRKSPPKSLDGSEALLDFYRRDVQPYLTGDGGQNLASQVKSAAAFTRVRNLSPVGIHPTVDEIEQIVDENRQLQLQETIHYWLHSWLLIHGPFSWAVVTMALVHAVVALYY